MHNNARTGGRLKRRIMSFTRLSATDLRTTVPELFLTGYESWPYNVLLLSLLLFYFIFLRQYLFCCGVTAQRENTPQVNTTDYGSWVYSRHDTTCWWNEIKSFTIKCGVDKTGLGAVVSNQRVGNIIVSWHSVKSNSDWNFENNNFFYNDKLWEVIIYYRDLPL